MYALVALGFVLIFKASGIFNYAQGVMALFAALTLVGIQQGQVPVRPSDQRRHWRAPMCTISAGPCRRCWRSC